MDEYTELDKEEKVKTTKLRDDEITLNYLQAITSPTVREQAKIRRLLVNIPKLETRLKELPALITTSASAFKKIKSAITTIEGEIKTIEKEIQTIEIADIRLLEKTLA